MQADGHHLLDDWRTSSFKVEVSADPVTADRPVSATADIRPPFSNGFCQSVLPFKAGSRGSRLRRRQSSANHADATASKPPQCRGFNSTPKLVVGLPGTASGDEASGRVDDRCFTTPLRQYAGHQRVHAGDLPRVQTRNIE